MDWAEAAAALDEALAHAGRTHGLEDVFDMLSRGEARCFAGERSVMVTQITDYPRARVHQLWLAGGDLVEIRDVLVPRAVAWGEAQGCDRTWVIGRPGWERELKEQGFAPAARLLVKEHPR